MDIYSISGDTSEYLPYTYRIGWSPAQTGLDYWVFYYGCKYGQGAHPDKFWVDYHTTSNPVAEKRIEWGEPGLIEIRKRFYGLCYSDDSSQTVAGYESRVLSRLRAAQRIDYLNQTNGRKLFCYVDKGRITVNDTDGNTMRISTEDPRYLSGELLPLGKGQVSVKDKDGNTMRVDKTDPRYLSGELVHVAKGKIAVKDKDGNKSYVDKTDPRYLSGELVHAGSGIPKRKGLVPVVDQDGKHYRVSRDDPRYLSGELVHPAKGNVVVRDKDGNTMRIRVDDPRYLSGELVHAARKINTG